MLSTAMPVVSVINSIVGVYYYMKVVLAIYTEESNEPVIKLKPAYSFVIIVCVVLIFLRGIFPSLLTGVLS